METGARSRQTREQLEARLTEALREARLAWQKATHDEREIARMRFVNVLRVYDDLNVNGIWPRAERQ